MKRKMLLIPLALLLIASLVACAAPTPAPTPAPAPAPAPPPIDEIVVAIETFWTGVTDPMLSTGGETIYLLQMYDWFVGTDKDGAKSGTENGIAESWKLSDDLLTWTFTLHKGVQFQDGKGEMTAEDVKFSIDRIMGPEGLLDRGQTLARNVESIEVIDKYNVAFHLKNPDPFLAYRFAPFDSSLGPIEPKKYVEEVGVKEFGLNPIGSGPYKLIEFVDNTYLKFEAMPDHWYVGAPKSKYLTMRLVKESATKMAMFGTGTLDLAQVTGAEAKELEAKGFTIGVKPGASVINLDFSYLFHPDNKDIPQQDVRVRKALNLAINRQEIVDTIYMGKGQLKPSGYTMPSWSVGYDASKFPPVPPYDPEQAKKLLAEAGYPDGFKQTIYDIPGAPEAPLINQAIASYWKAIGLEVDLIPIESGAHRKLRNAQELVPGSINSVTFTNREYNGGLIVDYSTRKAGGAGWKSVNAELDDLIDIASNAESMEVFIEGTQAVQIYVLENYLTIPLLESDMLYGLSPRLAKIWQGQLNPRDILNIRGMK